MLLKKKTTARLSYLRRINRNRIKNQHCNILVNRKLIEGERVLLQIAPLMSTAFHLKHCNRDNAFNRNGSSVFSGEAIETAVVLGPPTQFSLFRRLELFASQKHNVEGTRDH